jgi:hypothetical protein
MCEPQFDRRHHREQRTRNSAHQQERVRVNTDHQLREDHQSDQFEGGRNLYDQGPFNPIESREHGHHLPPTPLQLRAAPQ